MTDDADTPTPSPEKKPAKKATKAKAKKPGYRAPHPWQS